MKFLLDSCILIDLLRERVELQNKLIDLGITNCYIADIILAELYVGPYKSGSELAMRQVDWVEREFSCVLFGHSYRTYARLRAVLEMKGQKIDNMDLLIASIALDNDLTLVTRNARHFARIPDLKLEIWE